jgi:hypothetical protein
MDVPRDDAAFLGLMGEVLAVLDGPGGRRQSLRLFPDWITR